MAGYTPFPIRAKAEAKGRHPRTRHLRDAFLAGALWGYKERTEPVLGVWLRDPQEGYAKMSGLPSEPNRPTSLAEVADWVKTNPRLVDLEDVSRDGMGYSGPLSQMPRGRFEIVGPDPNRDRQFRGWLVRDDNGIRVEEIQHGPKD